MLTGMEFPGTAERLKTPTGRLCVGKSSCSAGCPWRHVRIDPTGRLDRACSCRGRRSDGRIRAISGRLHPDLYLLVRLHRRRNRQ